MDHDQAQESGSKASHGSESAADGRISEPVRSRWTPKPEQILILESIFNSGMVNPPKDETVRIRKLLEKFGSVGDANVFYWFQNRRSRSRRRQRQIQASLGGGGGDGLQQTRGGGGSGSIQFESMAGGGYASHNNSYSSYPMNAGSCFVGSGSSSSSSGGVGGGGSDGNGEGFYAFSGGHTGVQDFDHNAVFGASDSMHYPSGVITVFINGVATEVGRGPLDMKAMFGGEFVLFHSTGVPVQVNDYGFLVHSLQHGESYFLVPRNS